MTSPAEAARRLSAAVTADTGRVRAAPGFLRSSGGAAVGVDAAQRVLGPRQGEQALLAQTQAAGVRPPVRAADRQWRLVLVAGDDQRRVVIASKPWFMNGNIWVARG
jgi:hypothetical protein